MLPLTPENPNTSISGIMIGLVSAEINVEVVKLGHWCSGDFRCWEGLAKLPQRKNMTHLPRLSIFRSEAGEP